MLSNILSGKRCGNGGRKRFSRAGTENTSLLSPRGDNLSAGDKYWRREEKGKWIKRSGIYASLPLVLLVPQPFAESVFNSDFSTSL